MKAVYDEFTRTPELVGLAIEVERQGDRLHARFVGPWGPWRWRLLSTAVKAGSRTGIRALSRQYFPEPRVDLRRGLLLHAKHHVAVRVERDAYACVTEPLGDESAVHARVLIDRVQAVLIGGSAATGEVLFDVAVFRRELKRSLRARRGRSRSRPTWGATESSRTSLRAARRPINPSPTSLAAHDRVTGLPTRHPTSPAQPGP